MPTKKWTYPRSVTLTDKDGKTVVRVLTQLYKTGVYVAVYDGNDDIQDQLNLKPAQAVKFMNQFKEDNLKDGATSEFNNGKITVITDPDGFYVEEVAVILT